jgi:hypothetical protein
VLDRRDSGAIFFERRRQSRVTDVERVRRNCNRLSEVDPVEDNASVGGRRTQREIDACAGVKADAGRLDQAFQRALAEHGRG